MKTIRIANAPCSWGALEFDLEEKSLDYSEVLREMLQAGYVGSELGDWGFMPTEPKFLRKALDDCGFDIPGAFVPVAFKDEQGHKKGEKKALQVAELLVKAGFTEAFIVLADDNGSIPVRTENAGRITPELGLSDHQWEVFGRGVNKIAESVFSEFGLRTVFHHHCAGYVETPMEIDKLMEVTNPKIVGLCLDMGHCTFGGGDPLYILQKYYDRVWHVHFKDYDPKIGEMSRELGWDYFRSVLNGVFCKLGKGNVDFPAVTEFLKKNQYTGWIVVEQDVLPGMGKPLECARYNRKYIKSLGL